MTGGDQQFKGRKMLWSPKDTAGLSLKDVWLRPSENRRLETFGFVYDTLKEELLPSINNRCNVYQCNRNRIQNVFGNTQRFA